MIVDMSKLFLVDYAENFFSENTFGSSKTLAIKYDNVGRAEKPSRSRVCQFGQTLRDLKERGIIEKYSAQIYKKVKK